MPDFDVDIQDGGMRPPPSPEQGAKGKGCFFYGCAFSIVGLVIVLLSLAVGGFVLYRTWASYIEVYTAEAPAPLPRVEVSEKRREDVVGRARAFRDALRSRSKTEPLVLTGDDLNTLIQESPKFKDRVFLTLEEDEARAQVSMPLDEFIDTSLTRGRYFNGEAVLKVSVHRGNLKIEVESAHVGGKPLPETLRDFMEHADLRLNLDEEDRNELLREIETLEIEDGKVTITSRASAPEPSDEPPAPDDDDDQDAPKTEPDEAP